MVAHARLRFCISHAIVSVFKPYSHTDNSQMLPTFRFRTEKKGMEVKLNELEEGMKKNMERYGHF